MSTHHFEPWLLVIQIIVDDHQAQANICSLSERLSGFVL